MRTNFIIAFRFLTHKKRPFLISLLGTGIGIAFFIFTQAQTSGFEKFFIKTILGTNGALRIEDKMQNINRSIATATGESISLKSGNLYKAGIDFPQEVIQALQEYQAISGISEVIRSKVNILSGFSSQTALLHGIRLLDHLQVSDLANQIILGDLSDYRNDPRGIILGSTLAARLHVTIGDSVFAEYLGYSRNYRVAAIFETGIRDVDRENAFVHIDDMRALLKKPFGSSYIQINLFDPAMASSIAQQIEDTLYYGAASWQERERSWLEVFKVLRISSAITVFSIILIAGLGIFNTLAMMVMEKTREIAILRSVGYMRKDIAAIFIAQGMIVSFLGIFTGWILGAILTFTVSKLPIRIRGIFSTDHFIVHWSLSHYITAAILAFLVIMIASLIPSRRAARLEPGDIVRGSNF